ncbi:MAG TPA: bifunctional copper resistance protein CopD/cytochrome c oxidase assembly protein [Kineosporiaceae bacterium]|nr:bifunctional copper resistance protein CopD/cytochrome c oxidase assembly protein [Kineosporiaceae bacterium]
MSVAARTKANESASVDKVNAAVIAVVAVLAVSTGLAAAALSGAIAPTVIEDPGALVRWGLIAVRVIADLAAALTIGSLVLAAVALPVDKAGQAHRPALMLAAGTATLWAVTHIILLVFSLSETLGKPPGGPEFGSQLISFARDVSFGRALSATTFAAAAIGLLAAGATRIRSAGLLAVAAMAALIPTALNGHSNSSANHETAVTSLGVHLLGASVWVGGLAALLLLGSGLSGPANTAAVKRYSAVAGWAFAAVVLSGVLNAWPRLGGWSGLNTDYGLLVIGKTAALVLLGGAGYWHRAHTLAELAAGRRYAFAQLAAVELAVMAVAFGLAAALSRTPPPALGERTTDLAESITGYPLPLPPTASRWLTSWQPDLLWLLLAGLAAAGYLVAVRRLQVRGDRWPLPRTLAFLLGLAMLTYVTSGGPAVYGRVTFSGHMVMHMLLTMVVPPLLVLGGPILLALRVLTARTDGTRGPREWILAVLASGPLKVLAFPPIAALVFAGSLVVFYYSGLFELSLTTHVGHELMQLHFLLAGYLFAWVLVGIDPGPNRIGYPLRLIMLFATMAFHAFFFLALMNGTSVLQPDFFGSLGRTWGRALLADQQFGGGIGWGIGEGPTLLLTLVLAVQWSRSDDRDAKRYDRAADRDGDAELEQYNAMLAKLAGRSRS